MQPQLRQAGLGLLALAMTSTLFCHQLFAANGAIKVGLSISSSGSFSYVGKTARQGADLAKKEIDEAGGIKVGDQVYDLKFEYVDNASSRTIATANALNLIGKKQVLALIGPLSSDRAIASGEIANSFQTPMITPWSTDPQTTKDRPFVFRMAAMTDLHAKALTKFSKARWQATKAAVLYDEISPYPSGFAKFFKKSFEQSNGPGSVVKFETFRTGDTDFSAQLQAIIQSKADILLLPQHDTEVPEMIKQAHKLGWTKPIIGGNAWAGGSLMKQCGAECTGLFFSGNFAVKGATETAQVFIKKYQDTYHSLPDEPAALTYDSVKLLVAAIQQIQGLTGNALLDRGKLQKQLRQFHGFKGITGALTFDDNGDPQKCVPIIQIGKDGHFSIFETICP